MTRFLVLLASCGLTIGAAQAAPSADGTVTARHIVDTIESIFAIPPGARRSHLKPGICVAGSFTGTPAARRFSKAALFSGESVPVVGRFSLAGSNRLVPDSAPVPRGMALAFGETPDGQAAGTAMRMAMISVPVFSAATPGTFLGQMEAARPDPVTGKPDPARVAAFFESHPDTEPFRRYVAEHAPAPDYAGTTFHSVHAFRFINAAGRDTMVRWRFVPRDEAGDASEDKGSDFLNDALLQRLRKGPLRWDMVVTIAGDGDPTDNPTILWPEDRPAFRAGTLELRSATPEADGACAPVSFDPLILPPGIEASDDPVLNMRPAVYRLSLDRRTKERAER